MCQLKRILIAAVATLLLLTAFAGCNKTEETPDPVPPEVSGTELYTPEPTPTPTPTEEPEDTSIVISMVGDCTLASSQYNDHFEEVVGEDYSWPFAKVVDILGEDDFTIANLEGSFSDTPLSASTTFYFCAPGDYAQILTEGSVECATMGNNHTNEFGQTGVENTQAALEAVGVDHVGGGVGKIFDVKGMQLGVYVSPWVPTEGDVKAGVETLQNEGADFIIVCAHWGMEGSYRVNSSQTAVAHAAIDAGADVVCGTHPHVLQKTEAYGDGYIFYSLGNFSFGGNTNPRDKDTAIAQITIDQDEDGNYYLVGTNLIPCSLTSQSGTNNYQPVPYEEGTEAYDRTMSKLDGTFTGPDLVVDYSDLHNKDDETTEPSPSPEPGTETEDPTVPPETTDNVGIGGEADGETTTEPVGSTDPVTPPAESVPPVGQLPVEQVPATE